MDWSKKPAKYFRRTPATFFVIQSKPGSLCPGTVLVCVCVSTPALQAFRDQFGRNPSTTTDSEKLLRLKEEVAAKYGISADIITEEFSKYEPVDGG